MDRDLDLLELELRRLPGVVFVGFTPRADALVLHISTAPSSPSSIGPTAERLARARLRRHVVVEVVGEPRPSRVRLIHVGVEEEEPTVRYSVVLEYMGSQAVATSVGAGPHEVAAATVSALTSLGAELPYSIDNAAYFEHAAGEGVAVVLRSRDPSVFRLGIAAGDSVSEVAARATLQALNRDLSGLELTSGSA